MKIKLRRATADLLEDVVKNNILDSIMIKDIVSTMNMGGFAIIMFMFSIPILVPLPPPLPSFIAFPLLAFSFQMIIGLPSPRIPSFIGNRKIKRIMIANIIEKSLPFLRKIERLLKKRIEFICSKNFERVIGIFYFIFAFSILVPIPLSNLVPGIAIIIMSLGLLSMDGLVVLFGITVGIIGVIITLVIIFIGIESLYIAKDFIMNLML